MAFPLLFLLSFWFFRSLVAALLPLLVGGVSIVLTFLGLPIAAEGIDISVFALNLVTGLGLGLAIDYSLFIVSRYREEIAEHGPGATALRSTMNTAGRTVLFTSLTVAAALASLLVFPQKFLYSMGLGGVMVSLIAAAVALIVLPAVLALLGDARQLARAAAGSSARARPTRRPAESGFWYRLSRFVMRRPGRDRDRVGDADDRARPAVPARRLHVGRRARAARRQPRRAWSSERARARLPAQPHDAGVRGRRERVARRAAPLRAPGSSALPGAAAGHAAAPARRRRRRAIDVVSRGGELDDAQPGPRARHARRSTPASTRSSAGGPPSSSTSARASATTCRSRWRSSPWRRSSSCS